MVVQAQSPKLDKKELAEDNYLFSSSLAQLITPASALACTSMPKASGGRSLLQSQAGDALGNASHRSVVMAQVVVVLDGHPGWRGPLALDSVLGLDLRFLHLEDDHLLPDFLDDGGLGVGEVRHVPLVRLEDVGGDGEPVMLARKGFPADFIDQVAAAVELFVLEGAGEGVERQQFGAAQFVDGLVCVAIEHQSQAHVRVVFFIMNLVSVTASFRNGLDQVPHPLALELQLLAAEQRPRLRTRHLL